MLKINIGSGYKKYPDFLTLDMDPKTEPNFLINLEQDIFPFENDTIDEVRAWHILEHLGEGFFHCLKELYRICKDGAIIDIVVPHHRHDIFLADPTHKRPILVEGMRLFSKKHNINQVDTCGSSSTLAFMYNIDFEIIETGYTIDPFYEEYVRTTDAEIVMEKERSSNNFIQETKIKLLVIKDVG